jgi:O-methyltransferase
MFNPVILKVLDFLALRGVAHRFYHFLLARGYGQWMPLVPEAEFELHIGAALDRLLTVCPAETMGDYLEFGVSRGTSMACVYRALSARGLRQVRLIGFDSFEGMPPESGEEYWTPGDFHSTLPATRRYLSKGGVDLGRVSLVKGWFKDTLTEETRCRLNITKVSMSMVDCDIYSASRDALAFCEPYLRDYTVLVFDDWGWRSDRGEIGQKEAFEEFIAAHLDIRAEPLPAYIPQARIFLLTRKPARPDGRLDQST